MQSIREAATGRGLWQDHSVTTPVPITLWLVDRDEAYRTRLAEAISISGGVVCARQFAIPGRAFECMRHEPGPDLVVMDPVPGSPDESDVLTLLKRGSPAGKLIILTDCLQPDQLARSVKAGVSGFLLKDAPLPSLVDSIRDVHRSGASLAPAVAHLLLEMFRGIPSRVANYNFTPQERRIVRLMTRGLLMKQIANELRLSYHTVDSHLRSIYSKLGVHNRASAVAKILNQDQVFNSSAGDGVITSSRDIVQATLVVNTA